MSETATYTDYDTERVQRAVDEFVDRLESDNLQDGPRSELGGEVPGLLIERSEAEYNRLAALGKAAVDAYEKDHPR